jgi:hypothetical protein
MKKSNTTREGSLETKNYAAASVLGHYGGYLNGHSARIRYVNENSI